MRMHGCSPRVLTDNEVSNLKLRRKIEELKAWMFIIAFVAFAFGMLAGVSIMIVSEATPSVPSAYVECTTDEDCLEKNGCGGYSDPCDGSEPSLIEGEEVLSA